MKTKRRVFICTAKPKWENALSLGERRDRMPDLCDFSFYQEQYKGHLPEQEFIRFSQRAQAFLAFATKGKSEELPAAQNMKMALCAVTDEMAKEAKNGALLSEKAGEYAVTYRDGTKQADGYRSAALYLEDGVLFRGCGQC